MEETGDTRTRLLETAGEVFAEAGFREATVREICRRAGANIAAVNYHFGGKEQLYEAVLEHSFQHADKRYPINIPFHQPAEKQLAYFVGNTLDRMMDAGKPAWHGKLMMREFTEPTGQLDRVAERYMKPHFAQVMGIVRLLVGDKVPEERQKLLALSTMGQLVFYKTCREAVCRIAPLIMEITGDPAQRCRIAHHIIEVVAAGARAIREEYENVVPAGVCGAAGEAV